MHRPIALLLCFLLILEQTPLQQVLRIPRLMEHYQQHCQLKPNLTISEFLFLHCITDDGIPEDDQQEKDLPFHSMGNSIHLANFEWNLYSDFNLNPISPMSFTLSFYPTLVFIIPVTSNTWKPPRNFSTQI